MCLRFGLGQQKNRLWTDFAFANKLMTSLCFSLFHENENYEVQLFILCISKFILKEELSICYL